MFQRVSLCKCFLNQSILQLPNRSVKMEENKMHFRHLFVFYFRKGKNVAETVRKISAVYGEGSVAESTVWKWFARFKSGSIWKTENVLVGLC